VSLSIALLARSPSRLWPDFRITSGMQDCEYDHALGFDTVKDSIREARNKGATHFAVDTRKHLWIAVNRVEG